MLVRVPVVVKQKFGPQARLAYINGHDPEVRLRGHLELSKELDCVGFTYTVHVVYIASNAATIDISAGDLLNLAERPEVQHFELASPMS